MGGPRMDDRTWANGGKKAWYVCVVSLKQDRVDGHKLGKKQYTGWIVSCQLPASYEVLLAGFIPIRSTHIESGSFLPFILFSQSWLWLATLLPSYWGKGRGRKQHNVKACILIFRIGVLMYCTWRKPLPTGHSQRVLLSALMSYQWHILPAWLGVVALWMHF